MYSPLTDTLFFDFIAAGNSSMLSPVCLRSEAQSRHGIQKMRMFKNQVRMFERSKASLGDGVL
jgi:hypothetical protein